MSTNIHAEILINAKAVGSNTLEAYDFILNDNLDLVECVRIASLVEGIVYPVANYTQTLARTLFELNHVRVNPRIDNTKIISLLTAKLEEVGVRVAKAPSSEAVAVCFQPLGLITDKVRFHFGADGHFIFLCPRARFTLIDNQKTKRSSP
jgi:hypothetical protein